MTVEQAINELKDWQIAFSRMDKNMSYAIEALDMAIEALSEPSRQGQRDGLIKRQDVCDLIDNWNGAMISKSAFKCEIEYLPDAQPERKKGEWRPFNPDNEGFTRIYECSECNKKIQQAHYSKVCDFDICPNCGADMRGESDGQRNDADA